MKRAMILSVTVLLVALWPARAEEPDEVYLSIFTVIEQADSLRTKGQVAPALAKYQEAQSSLRNFQRTYPQWNTKTVTFRVNYVADKISALTEGGVPAAPGKSAAASPAGGSQAKLLEAGAEPRKQLRFHPKPGGKQTLSMNVKMTMDIKLGEMEMPAMKLPAINMTMEVTAKDVSSDGDIAYETVMSDATVAEDAEVMPQVGEAMKTAFANLKGLSGTGKMSNRGFNKEMDIKAPADADPQTRQAIEQMKESFTRFLTPLPEEAVGPGSKWEVKMPIKSQGMTLDQTTTYELVSIEGDRVTAKTTVIQTAANQKVQNPAMPNLKLDLTKMNGTGTGDLTADLAQLVPTAATTKLHSEMTMGMNTGGEKQEMNMKMDVNLRLESK